MIDVYSLFTIGLAFFVVAISPGPANISNAAIAMSQGRKVSFVYGVGLTMGLLLWGVVAASGLGVVLQGSVYVLMLLKILGGLYLLWLAWLSFKTSLQSSEDEIHQNTFKASYRRWFVRGFIMNSSNPKTVIAWMAALSVGLGGNENLLSLTAAVMVCMLVGFVVNTLYTALFSISGVMSAYQRFSRWINRLVCGLFTVLAGLGLIRSAFQRNPV